MERALSRILEALQPAADRAAVAGGPSGAGGLPSLGVAEMAALAGSGLAPEARRALEADLSQYVQLAGALRLEMPEMPLPFAAALLARVSARLEGEGDGGRGDATRCGFREVGGSARVSRPGQPVPGRATAALHCAPLSLRQLNADREARERAATALRKGPAGGGVEVGALPDVKVRMWDVCCVHDALCMIPGA